MVDASARRKAVVALVQRTNLVIHTVGERTFQHMDRFVDIRMPMGGGTFALGCTIISAIAMCPPVSLPSTRNCIDREPMTILSWRSMQVFLTMK